MIKKVSIVITLLMFICSAIRLVPHDRTYRVTEVSSPVSFLLNGTPFKYNEFDFFDTEFTEKNKLLAEKLNITEEEAFILGNLGKYQTEKLMKGRTVYLKNNNDLGYLKYSYRDKFYYSGFCLKNSAPCYQDGFDKILTSVRKSKYYALDLDTDNVYDISEPTVRTLKNFIILKKYNLPKHKKIKKPLFSHNSVKTETQKSFGDIKIYYTDSTSKLKPDRNCSSDICREILKNINNAQNSIDMAAYGYSRTPQIETALQNALNRGVKIRLIYDSDTRGNNIYPDTKVLTDLIKNNRSDIDSPESKNIMHNKFYIFDDKILITGSANLSHTDMSGFNSNSIVVINSPEAAKYYKKEFEQMYNNKFHNEKDYLKKQKLNISGTNVDICFSPKDKCLSNNVVPLINSAKTYIYIPTFVLTDRNVTSALINAKNRGVDVRIIIDALNASIEHSKHKELRAGGVLVKTENYAGKMHSKSMIVDDKYTIAGSMNFSKSGEIRNDENMLIIESEDITKFYKNFFLHQWNRIDNKWLTRNARAEGKDSIGSCTDGIDNNYDGLTDSEDPACR